MHNRSRVAAAQLAHTHTTEEGTQPITEDLFEGRSVYVAACDGLTADEINFTNKEMTTAM